MSKVTRVTWHGTRLKSRNGPALWVPLINSSQTVLIRASWMDKIWSLLLIIIKTNLNKLYKSLRRPQSLFTVQTKLTRNLLGNGCETYLNSEIAFVFALGFTQCKTA